MSTQDTLHGLACPKCGGMVPIPEGQVIVKCPFCEQRSLVRGERGFRRYQVPTRLSREQAQAALSKFLSSHTAIAMDASKKSSVNEAFIAYLPFWAFWTRALGWVFGQKRVSSGKTTTYRPKEVKITQDMSWNGAACDVGEFGVTSVPLTSQPLEAFDSVVLHNEGMVFEPVSSETDAYSAADTDFNNRLRQSARLDRIGQVYARFMREMRRTREAVSAEKHRPLIRKIAEEVIARYKEDIPPPTESIFEQERKGILEALDVFLASEKEWAGKCEPLLFEVTFGMGKKARAKKAKDKGEEEAAEEGLDEPVSLDIGGERPLALAGRIDRIDRVGEGCYRVVDYKTGSYGKFEEFLHFGRGKVLQHALYAIAAEQILKKRKIDARPKVVESGYYFPTRKGEGNKILREFDRDKFRKLVAEIIGVLEKGNFVTNPALSEKDCTEWCDYSAICGGVVARDRAKAKKDDNPDAFGIFDKLKDYE